MPTGMVFWPQSKDCAAGRVFLAHGQTDVLARYLNEIEGLSAEPLATLSDRGG